MAHIASKGMNAFLVRQKEVLSYKTSACSAAFCAVLFWLYDIVQGLILGDFFSIFVTEQSIL